MRRGPTPSACMAREVKRNAQVVLLACFLVKALGALLAVFCTVCNGMFGVVRAGWADRYQPGKSSLYPASLFILRMQGRRP